MSSDSSNNDFQATLTQLTHRTLKHVDSISSNARVVISLAEDFTGPKMKEDVTEHQEAAPPPPHADKDEPQWVSLARNMLPTTRASILLSDKLSFFFGALNCLITSLLFSHPRHFVRLFIFKSILLLGGRFAYYRTKNWHFYLAEFCYASIGLGVIQTLLFTRSAFLHKLVFGLMAGVLTPSVIATRNAFVLHNVDKITSLFQHLTPALVAWNMRWRTSEVVGSAWGSMSELQKDGFHHASFFQLTLCPLLFWAMWASAYYYVVFVRFDSDIQKKGLMTMYKQQTASPKSIVSKLVAGRKRQEEKYLVYLVFHGACCLTGFILNNIWWNSCLLHTAFVLICLCSSLWSGATFEIEVFAKRYYQNLPPSTPPPSSSSEPSPFSPVKAS